MMADVRFRLQINGAFRPNGPDPAPHTLAALLEVVAPFERALHNLAELAAVRPHGLAPLELVSQGSATTAVAIVRVPDVLRDPLLKLTSAVSVGDWQDIPAAAQETLHQLSQNVSRRQWRLSWTDDGSGSVVPGEISAAHPIPAPVTTGLGREYTTLYGDVMGIDGVDGSAHAVLRLFDDRVIPVDLSEALAKELAPRLFETVGLEGLAYWRLEPLQMERFRADKLLTYRKKPPDEALAALRQAVGDAFDDVDPLAYQRHLRGHDDE